MEVKDILKRTMAFGLGAAAFSAEKIKQFADDMVVRGEMSSDEAKKWVDEVSQKADSEKTKMQEWVREQVAKAHRQLGGANAESVKKLEARIAALEAKLGIETPPEPEASCCCTSDSDSPDPEA